VILYQQEDADIHTTSLSLTGEEDIVLFFQLRMNGCKVLTELPEVVVTSRFYRHCSKCNQNLACSFGYDTKLQDTFLVNTEYILGLSREQEMVPTFNESILSFLPKIGMDLWLLRSSYGNSQYTFGNFALQWVSHRSLPGVCVGHSIVWTISHKYASS